jgi:hypothetical protein
LYAFHEGRVIIAHATKPKKYKVEQLYEVVLHDGRSIIVTDQHRFLTQRGWVELQLLSKSDALCAVPCQVSLSLRQSTLGIGLSKFLTGVRRYYQTLVNYPGHCLGYSRQYGLQLQSVASNGLLLSQQPSDVRQHSSRALFRLDGLASACKDSPSLFLSRLSSFAVRATQVARNYTMRGSCNGDKSSERSLKTS